MVLAMNWTFPASIAGIFIILTLLITPAMPLHAGTASSNAVLRFNVGGHDYVDHDGNLWSSDAGYNSGIVATAPVPIYGTDDPVLYQTMRWDDVQDPELAYRFLLPNGSYNVNLYMSETAAQAAGERSFDVYMEDDLVHEAIDIYAESGGYGYAMIKNALVTVADGELNIDFVHQGGDPVINAIEVIPAAGVATGPDQPLVLTEQATGSTHILIGWDTFNDVSSPSVAGYTVHRDGVEIATTNLASYLDTNLSANTSYRYSVTSFDDAWNIIATSNTLNIMTPLPYEANLAPQITGTPADIIAADTRYIFQPLAHNNNGDPLSYSISNKPCWASFDTATGRLSGKPGTGDVGTFEDIVITATDGLHAVSLPAFSLQVLESDTAAELTTTGSFTVNWAAPKTRTDGTALQQVQIGGYRIYYGNAVGHYPYMVEVADGTAESATITDAPAGTLYVVMTTYDIDGRESSFSAVITKKII
jgi:hypothetical protein